jgi:NitT/TauT family transport system substrate-binding protein
MTSRITRWAALLLAMAMLVAACGDDDGADGEELDHISLQMSFSPTVNWVPYLYGIENGIFEEHGIELELISSTGGTFALQQLNENHVQFAQADMIGWLADQAANDPPTTAVMPLQQRPRVGVLTTVEADSLEDLVGYSIAHNPFDQFRFILPVILELQGLERDAIGLEPIQLTNSLLVDGQVDAVMVYRGGTLTANLLEAQRAGIPVYHLEFADFGYVNYEHVVVVRDEVIAGNPDLVRRFLAALEESISGTIEAPDDEIVDLLATQIPAIDREVQTAAWQDVKAIWDPSLEFDPDVVAILLGYVRDGTGIEHDIQPEDVFTNDLRP